MFNLLTDERLAEMRCELEHDLWPSVVDLLALVKAVEVKRVVWDHLLELCAVLAEETEVKTETS